MITMQAKQTHRLGELIQLLFMLSGKAVVLAGKNSDEQSENIGLRGARISREELLSRTRSFGGDLDCGVG